MNHLASQFGDKISHIHSASSRIKVWSDKEFQLQIARADYRCTAPDAKNLIVAVVESFGSSRCGREAIELELDSL